jgi:hypothetical protein
MTAASVLVVLHRAVDLPAEQQAGQRAASAEEQLPGRRLTIPSVWTNGFIRSRGGAHNRESRTLHQAAAVRLAAV